MRVASRVFLLLVFLPSAVVFAESERERRAREDLEQQLKAIVGTPPTKIRIEFVGFDNPPYELIDARFKLDGRTLPVPDLKKLSTRGEHLVFHGDVEPGEHRLESKLEFQNNSPTLLTGGGYKWKPGSDISFRTESGIEVRIKVTPQVNAGGDLKERVTVKSPASIAMLAKLDDGKMPEPARAAPPAEPVKLEPVAPPEPVDAGVTGLAEKTEVKPAKRSLAAAKAARLSAMRRAAAEEAKALDKKQKAGGREAGSAH
jgi:hypothetical protein